MSVDQTCLRGVHGTVTCRPRRIARLWQWQRTVAGLGFLAAVLVHAPRCGAADPPPALVLGQPCELHVATEPDLALADDNGFCSFRLASEAKPMRFKMVAGLADTNLVSFESVDRPGFYLRHFFFRLKIDRKPDNRDPVFAGDATFEIRSNRAAGGVRVRSSNYRECYVAVTYTKKAYIVPDPNPEAMGFEIIYW